jgi:putative DNA primase/helicase
MQAALRAPDSTRDDHAADLPAGHLPPIGTLLSEVKPERVEWLWPGRIARGKVTLIDGDPGRGKSVLTLNMAARVSTGTPWPDSQPCPRGGVVLLSAEDGLADTIRPRLDAAGADTSRILALDLVGSDSHPILLPDDLDAIAAGVRRVGAVLVIVDPVMAFLGGEVNAHRDQDVRRALRPLADLAEEMGFAVVVIRHLNKAATAPALYRGGGSIAFTAAARIAFVVGADPQDDKRRILAPLKANLSAAPPALAFRLVEAENHTVQVLWEGESPLTARELLALPAEESTEQGSARADAEAFLRDLLADGPIESRVVLKEAREAGVSEITLRRAKQAVKVRVEKAGMRGGWTWRLAECDQDTPKVITPGERSSSALNDHLRGQPDGAEVGLPGRKTCPDGHVCYQSPNGSPFCCGHPAAATT